LVRENIKKRIEKEKKENIILKKSNEEIKTEYEKEIKNFREEEEKKIEKLKEEYENKIENLRK
jgi:hypothetical protein